MATGEVFQEVRLSARLLAELVDKPRPQEATAGRRIRRRGLAGGESGAAPSVEQAPAGRAAGVATPTSASPAAGQEAGTPVQTRVAAVSSAPSTAATTPTAPSTAAPSTAAPPTAAPPTAAPPTAAPSLAEAAAATTPRAPVAATEAAATTPTPAVSKPGALPWEVSANLADPAPQAASAEEAETSESISAPTVPVPSFDAREDNPVADARRSRDHKLGEPLTTGLELLPLETVRDYFQKRVGRHRRGK